MATISQAPATLDIVAVKGDDLTITLSVTESSVAYDWTGATVASAILDTSGTVLATNFTTSTPANGTLILSLTDTNTTAVGVGTFRYWVSVTKSSATRTWLAGALTVMQAGWGGTSTSSASLSITTGSATVSISSVTGGTAAGISVTDAAGYYAATDVEGVLAELGPATDRIQYVLPTGNDSNTGKTWAQAKLTINAAAQALPSTGGEIIFAGTLTSAQTLSKSGISVRGLGRTSVIYVTTNTQLFSVSNCSKVRLSNFRLLGSGNNAHTSNTGVMAINVADSVFDGLIVESCGYDGIELLSGCTDNVVTNCRISSSGDDGINVGGDAVTPTARNIVNNNVITGCGNVGIHLSNGSDNSVVVGNSISSCSIGIDTLSGVDGNIIIGNMASNGIQLTSNDNVLRGNVGTVTDSGTGNSYEVDRNEDYWWSQRYLSAESLPRLISTSAAVATGNQNLRLTYFTAQTSFTAANMTVASGSTAAGATPTLVRLGLYTVASNGDLTLVASTASDTSLLASTNTLYTKALSSSYAVVKGQRYAAALLVVTSATAPTVVGQFPGGSTATLSAASPRLVGLVAAQSDLPSSVLSASVTNSNNAQWIGLTV